MKFKAVAFPPTSPGERSIDVDMVVPDQSMTLKEILLRFTRNETLPIGRDPMYSDGLEDIEKLRDMDLVDREAYVTELKAKQAKYKAQEEAKRKAAVEAEIKRQAEEAAAKAKAMASPTP